MTRAQAVAAHLALILVVTLGGFVVLQAPTRTLEAEVSRWIVSVLGAHGRVSVAYHDSVVVLPASSTPFRAVITPSCSSLTSILAVVCLSSTMPPGGWRRRSLGALLGMTVVFLGNIVRISASIGVGLVAGRASLVLFHDWVGGLLTFVYTLVGYTAMLYVVLPSRPDAGGGLLGPAPVMVPEALT